MNPWLYHHFFYPPKSQFFGSHAVFRHVHVVNDADDVWSHGRLMSYKSEVMVMNGGCCRISRGIFMSKSMDVMLGNVHGEGTCSFGHPSQQKINTTQMKPRRDVLHLLIWGSQKAICSY